MCVYLSAREPKLNLVLREGGAKVCFRRARLDCAPKLKLVLEWLDWIVSDVGWSMSGLSLAQKSGVAQIIINKLAPMLLKHIVRTSYKPADCLIIL
jgi:hypothetical protein